jgi:hypothetical protein
MSANNEKTSLKEEIKENPSQEEIKDYFFNIEIKDFLNKIKTNLMKILIGKSFWISLIIIVMVAAISIGVITSERRGSRIPRPSGRG